MNLHILRDRILRLWQVAGDSMGKSILDKRQEGILWTVWNVVVSYWTEWLWDTHRMAGSIRRGNSPLEYVCGLLRILVFRDT
jgi:hypothetical protein